MKLAQFSTMASRQRIDAASGIIYGVSVITKGEAATHDIWVDDTTCENLIELSKKNSDGVRVKMVHDAKNKQETSPVISIVGALKEFRKDGDKVRADFHLLKSDPNFDKILEMAEKQPKDFGLSIAAMEFSVERVDGKDFIRVEDLGSVDLTADPAANVGLFSKKDKDGDYDDSKELSECMCKGKGTCKFCMNKKEMSEKSKIKTMSALFAKALGLDVNATEETIALELTKRLTPADTTELSKKITDLETKISADKSAALELAKKTEIAALVAEASAKGKEIPLSDAQLSKMDVADVKEMITKIKPTVNLSKGIKPTLTLPKDNEGKEIFDRHTPEGRAKVVQFCRQKQSENSVALGAEIRELNKQFLN